MYHNNVINVRPSWIFMDGYGSKISRWWPAVLSETIPAIRQEFFFTKVALVQSITNIVLLDFWLILLSWMFISSYTTIYFFVKKFIFSNIYISVNTIFECLYMFFGWERVHQISAYTTGGEIREGHPKWVQMRMRKGWLFCAETRPFISKLTFTHFISCWSRGHMVKK